MLEGLKKIFSSTEEGKPMSTMDKKDISREKSAALYEKAKKYFPGGVNSPVRAFKSVYGTPLFIQRGDGCKVWDADGNEFIDFCGSWGPLILGHNNEKVRKKVMEVAKNGWIDEQKLTLENMYAFARAGAGIIISYHTREMFERNWI